MVGIAHPDGAWPGTFDAEDRPPSAHQPRVPGPPLNGPTTREVTQEP